MLIVTAESVPMAVILIVEDDVFIRSAAEAMTRAEGLGEHCVSVEHFDVGTGTWVNVVKRFIVSAPLVVEMIRALERLERRHRNEVMARYVVRLAMALTNVRTS